MRKTGPELPPRYTCAAVGWSNDAAEIAGKAAYVDVEDKVNAREDKLAAALLTHPENKAAMEVFGFGFKDRYDDPRDLTCEFAEFAERIVDEETISAEKDRLNEEKPAGYKVELEKLRRLDELIDLVKDYDAGIFYTDKVVLELGKMQITDIGGMAVEQTVQEMNDWKAVLHQFAKIFNNPTLPDSERIDIQSLKS